MRKVIIIVSIILVVALATLVTLSLVIKKDYSNSISLENPSVITIYKSGASLSLDTDPNGTLEEYNIILDMINDASISTYMNAFIKGTMLYENSIETTPSSNLTLTATDKIYIKYSYDALQSLMFDGEVYENTLTETEAKYKEVVFEINNTNEMAVAYIYFSDSETTTFYKKYQLTTRMNTAALYEYIDEMYIPA